MKPLDHTRDEGGTGDRGPGAGPDPRQRWRDILLRRALTPEEAGAVEAWMEEHPEAKADWVLEVALAESLRGLPDVPVASNFTSAVMEGIRGDGRRRGGQGVAGWRQWLAVRWLPLAGGVAVLAVVGLSAWQVGWKNREREYARQVAALRVIAELPPTVLVDYDAIRRYGESLAPVDLGLLAALE